MHDRKHSLDGRLAEWRRLERFESTTVRESGRQYCPAEAGLGVSDCTRHEQGFEDDLQSHFGSRGGTIGQRADGGAGRHRDDRLVFQRSPAHRSRSQFVLGSQHHQPIGDDGIGLVFLVVVAGVETKICSPCPQRLVEAFTGNVDHFENDVRVFVAIAAQERWQPGSADRGKRRDSNRAFLDGAVVRHIPERIVEISQHFARGGEKFATGIGEVHAARAALDQANVEIRLELLNERRQRGLRKVDRFRRFREMLLLRKGDERDQMPNIRDRRQSSSRASVRFGANGTPNA